MKQTLPVYHVAMPRPFISPLALYGHASCKFLLILWDVDRIWLKSCKLQEIYNPVNTEN